jgi:uncharacterized damage-inducible protein DinB
VLAVFLQPDIQVLAMKKRSYSHVLLAVVCALTLGHTPAVAQTVPPELGQGWLPEFTLTSRQLLRLAEATPEEKFGWRPAPGVRSISEVYMHIALANFFFLDQAGIKPTVDRSSLPKDAEKAVNKKADVLEWLRRSIDAVGEAYKSADRQKKVTFFRQETTVDHLFLRLLIHNNEHMGQSIAYARMNGIVPPWTSGG